LFYFLCELVEVHVTGITIIPGADNSHLRFFHVGIGKSDPVQHGLGRG
jgi:hypothetical protein